MVRMIELDETTEAWNDQNFVLISERWRELQQNHNKLELN